MPEKNGMPHAQLAVCRLLPSSLYRSSCRVGAREKKEGTAPSQQNRGRDARSERAGIHFGALRKRKLSISDHHYDKYELT